MCGGGTKGVVYFAAIRPSVVHCRQRHQQSAQEKQNQSWSSQTLGNQMLFSTKGKLCCPRPPLPVRSNLQL